MTSANHDFNDIDLGMGHDEPVRFHCPHLPSLDDIARYYALAEDARLYSGGGPCNQRLSTRLAAYVGGVHCVPVANCTLGLMVALRDLCGDATANRRLIAVPSFSSAATAFAIRWAGFEPLFVDIDEGAWQLDPSALDEALTEHAGSVAGILGCSTFGSAPPSETRTAWRELGAGHGLPLLLDSAAGFGAIDDAGRRLGAQGDVEVFSFHATEPFAIGEGGAIVTADADQAERLSRLINPGDDVASQAAGTPAINAAMAELAAAAGLAMLDIYDTVLADRRATASQLQGVFSGYPLTYQQGCARSTWPVFSILLPDEAARVRAVALARELKIEIRTSFDPPVHKWPAFAGSPRGVSLAVTEALAGRALTLPLANALGPRQVVRLAELVDMVLAPATR
jgi:dTDP-4-amino-4,6-dideoxygalactose transaminase